MGERLKKAREDKKLSQVDVAKELNISRQSISKWENDRVSPDVDNLIRLSNLYNLSLDDLTKNTNANILDENINNKKSDNEFKAEYEWIMLMILCLLSALAAPLGLILPLIMIKNNTFHKLINIACVVCILINIYHIYMVLGDYYYSNQLIEIKKQNKFFSQKHLL